MPSKKTISSSKAFEDLDLLGKELVLNIYDKMLRSRALEERLIKIYKMGEAFFWIGGPGEEAFGVPLGLLVHKGQGVEYDYLHLHYRCTPTLIAMGMKFEDSIRLIMNKKGDVCTGGRNFSNHYCFPEMNITPVSSPIEIQYGLAVGTALAQKNSGSQGISIVTGGDAGSAEGDFASSLVWASRPANPLPVLLTVQNNGWGISTSYKGQHGEDKISDRGKAFGIKSLTINGNDPIESYIELKKATDYIRKNKKPVLIEAYVSRLYGHSSASGANIHKEIEDPLALFESRLIKAGYLTQKQVMEKFKEYEDECFQVFRKIQKEEGPAANSIWDHTYANQENADWRKF